MIIMLLLVGLVLGGIFAFKQFQASMIKKYMSQMSTRPQTVSAVSAQVQEWNKNIDAVGSFTAIKGIDVSTEVAGIIEDIYFNSGDYLTEGTLLAKLRDEDDLALLASLKADAHLAKITHDRDLKQLEQKAIAQSIVDLDEATLEKSLALIKQQEAIIQKKYIRAPFSGRLGISPINAGQYIGPGTVIVPLQVLDPIYFDFYLPQQDLASVRLGQQVFVRTNVYPDKIYSGKMEALNAKVDQSSRNILVRAILDNQANEILPGMYGTIVVDTGQKQNYITLPITAITYNPYGNTVFIAKPVAKGEDGSAPEGGPQYVAEQRFVTVGPTRGDQIAVIDGIQPGEMVVVAGQIKLQNGVALNINNDVMPSDEIKPQVSEQ